MKWCLFFLMFSLVGCSSDKQLNFRGFEKMLGKWKAVDGQNVFYETWSQEKTRMTGTGFMLQGKDTAFGEKLIVEFVNEKLVYIADVKKQNPAMFTCNAQTETGWIFDNPDHDFPNKISYYLISPQKLTVILEGIEEGKPIVQKLSFVKVANE